MGYSLTDFKGQLEKGFSGLVDAGFENLQNRYLSTPGSLNAPAATVAGNNVPVTAGVRQPVVAATVPDSPSMPKASGMSPLAIAGVVLAVLGVGVIAYKVLK